MTGMIDGPMLVGIAALITSIANVIANLRPRDRSPDRAQAPYFQTPDGEGRP